MLVVSIQKHWGGVDVNEPDNIGTIEKKEELAYEGEDTE